MQAGTLLCPQTSTHIGLGPTTGARARAASRVPDASLSVGARGAHTTMASTVQSGVPRSWLFPSLGVDQARPKA